ncbi:MAG: gliding motility-associated C-terminal domain-containing protein [Saprospiraceae bacterium]
MKKSSFIFFLVLFGFAELFAQTAANRFVLSCLEPCVRIEIKKSKIQQIAWKGPKGFQSADLNPKVCDAGIYPVTYKIDGTWYFDSVLVENQKFIPLASVDGSPNLSCIFDCRTLNGNNPGPGFGATWYGPAGLVENKTSIKVCAPGKYIYTIFKGVCLSTDTIHVKDNRVSISANAGADVSLNCKQVSTKLKAVFPGSEYQFEWKNAKGKQFSTQLNPVVNEAGVYFFHIKRGVCSSTDSVKVSADFRKPELSGKKSYQLTCNSPILYPELSCSVADAKFEWKTSNGKSIANNMTPGFKNAGVYYLKSYWDQNGCSDTLSVAVRKADSIVFAYRTTMSCANESNGVIYLDKISGGVAPYGINVNNLYISTNTEIPNLKSGVYSIKVSDSNGCSTKLNIEVAQKPTPQWNLLQEFSFCSYEKPLEIDATIDDPEITAATYLWHDGVKGPKHNFMHSERAWVEVKSTCFSERKYIEVKDRFDRVENASYYAPNIINPLSPNPINRCFQPFLGFDVLTYDLIVYDRWGNQVFRTNKTDDCWDGTFRGKSFNYGTFFWQINANINGCGFPVPWQKSGGISIFTED